MENKAPENKMGIKKDKETKEGDSAPETKSETKSKDDTESEDEFTTLRKLSNRISDRINTPHVDCYFLLKTLVDLDTEYVIENKTYQDGPLQQLMHLRNVKVTEHFNKLKVNNLKGDTLNDQTN